MCLATRLVRYSVGRATDIPPLFFPLLKLAMNPTTFNRECLLDLDARESHRGWSKRGGGARSCCTRPSLAWSERAEDDQGEKKHCAERGIEKWEGEGRERCGEFGTKAAACIVNCDPYGISWLDCVYLVVAHMVELTPFLLNLLLLRVSIYFSIMTRPMVEALHEKKIQRKIWIQVLSWSEAKMPDTITS